MTEKNLAYYEEHPEEMEALSVEEIEKLHIETETPKAEGKGTEEVEGGEAAKTEGEKPASEVEAPAATENPAAAATDEPNAENAVVTARDGKHQIPFSVLENARNAATQATQQLEEANRRNQELMQQMSELQAKAAGEGDKPDGSVELPSTETGAIDFAKLRAEYPEEVVNALEQSFQVIGALSAKVGKLEAVVQDQVNEDAVSLEQHIQNAIDAIPILAKWQSEGSPMFDAAAALDDGLKNDPQYADLSLHDRFKQVVKMLGADPGAESTSTTKPSKEELERKAAEALAAAGNNSAPRSLSDIPGGNAPTQNERQSVETMTVTQLESNFEKMTPTQIDAYLARL